jgi:membrane associated rhomboid family serine protease
MEVHPRWETLVFGPLPQLHRLLVVLTALAVGIASGVWGAQFSSVPVAAASGAAWGALAGGLLGFVLLHDFHHRPRAARVRRPH